MDTLESRIYEARFASGALDLCCGIVVAGIGLAFRFDHTALLGVVPAIGIALFLPIQQRVVLPRLGAAALTEEQQAQTTRDMRRLLFGGVMMLTANLAVLGGLGSLSETALQQWIGGLPAALLAVLSASAGWVLVQNRFFLYAVVLLAGALVTGSHGADPGSELFTSGAAMLAVGGLRFAQFLREHPSPAA